jgi:hypothetical protein
MDEFARLMSMEGVRPLDQPKEKPRSLAQQPSLVSSQGIVAPPELSPIDPAWVTATADTAKRTQYAVSGRLRTANPIIPTDRIGESSGDRPSDKPKIVDRYSRRPVDMISDTKRLICEQLSLRSDTINL